MGAGSDELQEFFRATYKKVHLSIFLSFFKNKMPLIFPYNQVTEADIEEFEANYRGSESEEKDLKDLYKRFKGNMNRYRLLYFHDFFSESYLTTICRLFCSMLCSEPKLDSHRFKDILDLAISKGMGGAINCLFLIS